jgi:3',5'-cyclic-nucleotide phosphodiesterase
MTSATLMRVTEAAFVDLVRARPELAGAVVGKIAVRLLQARAACVTMARAPAPGAGVAARLLHVESGSYFPLPAASEAVVGRADPRSKSQPDVELSSVDAHRSLSRRHAVVKRVETGYRLVEEPRVANGTFLNGRRLRPGVAVPLKDGDEVSFGLIRTVFRTR